MDPTLESVGRDDTWQGSAWRIWDLHVHTPASIVQGYGGNTEEAWSRSLDELEALPEYERHRHQRGLRVNPGSLGIVHP